MAPLATPLGHLSRVVHSFRLWRHSQLRSVISLASFTRSAYGATRNSARSSSPKFAIFLIIPVRYRERYERKWSEWNEANE